MYKDPKARAEYQRNYQREWMARRRREFFEGKVCAKCGSDENLTLHHRDKTTKVSHRIWSWARERFEREAAKCDVLCNRCHTYKHAQERIRHGRRRYEKGCRCDVCRAAKLAHDRRGRERKRAA